MKREQILVALERLNAALVAEGVRAECYLVGGAVMCLVFNAREATKDVDGWFTEPQAVRRAAARVAAELQLPEDWLNDAAKAFVPQGATFERWRSLSNLEVSVADERTLLAMKCAAARSEEDAGDIRILAGRLGLRSAKDILDVVLASIPPSDCRCGPACWWRRCSMTALECLRQAKAAGAHYQRVLNGFMDELRRASPLDMAALVAEPIEACGPMEGMVAAIVSAIFRERDASPPPWVGEVYSPEPFFAFPARGYAMRVRLMFESPPAFRVRNVFVPENYLSRA